MKKRDSTISVIGEKEGYSICGQFLRVIPFIRQAIMSGYHLLTGDGNKTGNWCVMLVTTAMAHL
ncbi:MULTISPECIES: hypothetical protein [Bartonella]|uniref:hypothetical protein n=1 Tax=Bartonella TaxID=773 RepID=UPI0018DC81C6|nr:hypothetical protein [Bartonella choladocola]MBI0140976.1 hypothetical protein [Bartonella choladocola]